MTITLTVTMTFRHEGSKEEQRWFAYNDLEHMLNVHPEVDVEIAAEEFEEEE